MSEERDRCGAVPLCWADGAPELAALAIDEKRSRQAHRAHRPQCLAGAVDIYRKLLHVEFSEHFPDRVDPLAIDRYCDDCEVRAAQSRSEMVERGNFLDAGCAPS